MYILNWKQIRKKNYLAAVNTYLSTVRRRSLYSIQLSMEFV